MQKPKCPYCSSYDTIKKSIKRNVFSKKQTYKCKESGKRFTTNNCIVRSIPKILVLDIETAPLECYTWGIYDQTIFPDNIIADWFILCWSAKWLFDEKVLFDAVTCQEAINRDDKRISESIWKLLDEADIVVAQNGKDFDLKRLNTRFIINGFRPPLPYQVIDTLVVAKQLFSFSSNKLDYINKQLNLPQKTKTDFELWKRCVKGDKKSLLEMSEYNQNDVLILEDTFAVLRPWIRNHPNLGVYVDTIETVCPTCGHEELTWKGFYVTPCGKFRTFRCDGCGAIGRSRFNEMNKEKMKGLVKSV